MRISIVVLTTSAWTASGSVGSFILPRPEADRDRGRIQQPGRNAARVRPSPREVTAGRTRGPGLTKPIRRDGAGTLPNRQRHYANTHCLTFDCLLATSIGRPTTDAASGPSRYAVTTSPHARLVGNRLRDRGGARVHGLVRLPVGDELVPINAGCASKVFSGTDSPHILAR